MRSKLRFLLFLTLGILAVLQVFRIAFLWHFEGLNGLGQGDLWRALYLGLKFDLRLTLLLVAPAWLLLNAEGRDAAPWKKPLGALLLTVALAVYATLVIIAMADDVKARPWLVGFLLLALGLRTLFPEPSLKDRAIRWIWGGYGALMAALLLIAYAADFGAYSYVHTRLSGTLLMFAENASTSARMVWESYPVLRVGALLVLLLAGLVWLLGRACRSLTGAQERPLLRWSVNVTVTLLLILGLWGKWSRYPLRWSEAFDARKGFYAQLALNPVLFFLETRVDEGGHYDLDQVKATHAAMAEYFGVPVAFDAKGLPTLRREGQPLGHVPGEPNVVFIQLESLAAFKTGLGGNALKPTPFLDELATKSLSFDRFFVVMPNTSRSMFATLFGIPDLTLSQNATRNPLLVEQHSVLAALEGRDRSFWLGGSANWAQIRGVLKNNFKGLDIHDEGAFPGVPVVDVWGIADADLLLQTHEALVRKTRPFWAFVQTSGNHPPFTVPKHFADFHVETKGAAELKANGFVSNEEYNAVRLMDYSLRRYFQAAAKAPYFQNTVFVLWADHGVPRGSTDPRFGDLGLGSFHIPFLIYAPGLPHPGKVIHTLGTQMDILPTLMSFLGRPYWHQTLGKDLLDPAWEDKAVAFTYTLFRQPASYGLIQGDHYVNVDPQGQAVLYRLNETDPRDHAKDDPERAARMKRLCQGFAHWSRYLLSHNKEIVP
ncbi:MAG: sulfatase-like hydrolase/transferase [Firmicutes bacterium]|nr:sulfatase-like hydrolase/transferase [Bacillota bacterium]